MMAIARNPARTTLEITFSHPRSFAFLTTGPYTTPRPPVTTVLVTHGLATATRRHTRAHAEHTTRICSSLLDSGAETITNAFTGGAASPSCRLTARLGGHGLTTTTTRGTRAATGAHNARKLLDFHIKAFR